MRSVLIAALLAPASALAAPETGDVEWVDARTLGLDDINWVETRLPQGIVNGENTTDYGNVMALVAYFGNNQGFQFCSATQISDDFVLTAAHCAEAGEDYQAQGGTLFLARTNNVYQTAQDGWFEVGSNGVFIHPDWVGNNSQEVIHDVALLQTTTAITGTGGPAVLNDETIDDSWIGRELRFVGFGVTDDGGQDSGIKRTTAIAVADYEFGIVYSYDPDTNVCSGDSGGAAFEVTPDGLELTGVNSFVFQVDWQSDPCDGGANGAARVDSYLDWILDIEPDVRTDWEVIEPEPEPGPGDGDPNNPADPSDPGADMLDDAVIGAGCACSSSNAPTGLAGLFAALSLVLVRRRS